MFNGVMFKRQLSKLSLLTNPQRSFFFMRRPVGKVRNKTRTDFSEHYNPESYIKAIKKLQTMTKGMLRDEPEYINIKNNIFKELNKEKKEQAVSDEDIVTLNLDSFYINLICIPEELECYEIMHILQYNGILIHVDEDN